MNNNSWASFILQKSAYTSKASTWVFMTVILYCKQYRNLDSVTLSKDIISVASFIASHSTNTSLALIHLLKFQISIFMFSPKFSFGLREVAG